MQDEGPERRRRARSHLRYRHDLRIARMRSDAVLSALSRQADRGFEVVIADDGSVPRPPTLVERWRPRLGVALGHVWQEHRGFRAAEIRNRAHPRRRAATIASSSTATASRGPTSSRRIGGWPSRAGSSPATACCFRRRSPRPCCATACSRKPWIAPSWLAQRRRGGVNRLAAVLRLPLGPLRKLGARQWRGARSCNLAVWRSDLDRVDGFDASFSGWGREDSDLLVRLLHAGVRRKDGRFRNRRHSPLASPKPTARNWPPTTPGSTPCCSSDRTARANAVCRRCATLPGR